ncbi:hypothetical protein BGZ65_006629, partial [Modicella reniformis]
MISLRIDNHKIRFRSYPNSFTAEAAVANLGNLQVIQSNRVSDPNDPTRIISQVTTTQFALSRDMARNLCQTFMDARLFESATDLTKREFQPRGLYQVTPKGAHLLAKFVVRNSSPNEESRRITSNATASLVYLERTDDEDAIILNLKQVDTILKRFAGPEPNVSNSILGDTPMSPANSGGRERTNSVKDLCNGIEVNDQQYENETYKHTFYGKAAVEWLLDYTAVISKEEAICVCQEMVNAKYIEQVGEENTEGPSLFRTGNSTLYHLTEIGRALAGWKSLDSTSEDWMDKRTTNGAKNERGNVEVTSLSAQFNLTANNLARLPISLVNRERHSMDEASLAGAIASNDEPPRGPTRRLSQILNDPAFQLSLSEAPTMSSYAPSSSGKDSVGAGPGGARLTPPLSSSQSTTSNTSRLNGILSDAPVRDLFKNFLKQNFCEENLSFYLEVLDYRTKFGGLITAAKAYNISPSGQDPNGVNVPYPPSLRELEKQTCSQAFAIYETYLVSGAPREVNLPHQMRHDIMAYMQALVRNMEAPELNNKTSTKDKNRKASSTPSSLSSQSSDASENGGQRVIHISLFDMIHEHIFRLMSSDSVPKFIKTDKYLEVVMNKHKRKSTSSVSSSTSSISLSALVSGPNSNNGSTAGLTAMGQDGHGGNMHGQYRWRSNHQRRNVKKRKQRQRYVQFGIESKR